MTDDPFGTAALRAAVLDAWRGSPTRFREDANTEADHARGHYRDRVVVELAQNAADAATRAGVPGRLLLRLVAPDADGPWTLVAANTGTPVDARGVASLASMRASAKVPDAAGLPGQAGAPDSASASAGSLGPGGLPGREETRTPSGPPGSGEMWTPTDVPGPDRSEPLRAPAHESPAHESPAHESPAHETPALVGRFGVGFAAVRSVADEMRIGADDRAVAFSLARTMSEIERLGAEALVDRGTGTGPLAGSVARRGRDLPVLRLPFPARVDVPEGYATAVVLELRDADALAAVRAQLAALDDALLLGLPALAEVVVEDDGRARRLADVTSRWLVVRRSGQVDPSLLGDRPVEERRPGWSVTWALPRLRGVNDDAPSGNSDAASGGRRLLHAPTPTDEALTFPALLVATFPLDPSRRHVAAGPLADEIARRAGAAYADLLAACVAGLDPDAVAPAAFDPNPAAFDPNPTVPDPDVLGLVPTEMPASAVDAAIREAALAALRDTPLFVVAGSAVPGPDPADHFAPADPADPGTPANPADHPAPDDHYQPIAATVRLLAPADAVAIRGSVGADPLVARALAFAVPLVALPERRHAVARQLGVRTPTLADVVDDLPAVHDPARYRAVYEALGAHAHESGVVEALASIPVPLLDGRVARGARGLLVLPPGSPIGGADVGELGLRVVDPAAADPLLERLGARVAGLDEIVADDAVRERVLALADAADDGEPDHDQPDDGEPDDGEPDDGEPDHGSRDLSTLLALVRARLDEAPDAALPFWWGELPLPTADGDPTAARECAIPGSWAADVLDGLERVDGRFAAHWGADVLRAVGAHAEPAVYRVPDVVTPLPGEEPDPDPWGPPSWLSDWSGYLAYLTDVLGPGAFVGDVEAVADLDTVADDRWADVLARLAGTPRSRAALLGHVRAAGVAGVSALSYTAWWLREELGGPFALRDGSVPFLREEPDEVTGLDDEVRRALGGVGGPADLDASDWAAYLSDLPDVGTPVEAPDAAVLWRALADLAVDGVEFARLPDRLPGVLRGRVGIHPARDLAVAPDPMWSAIRPVLPAPAAALEDLADLLGVDVVGAPGDDAPAPDDPGELRALDTALAVLLPGVREWRAHPRLRVGDAEVAWWVERQGGATVVHAATLAGLARGLAAAVGRFDQRHLVAAALADPATSTALADETVWD